MCSYNQQDASISIGFAFTSQGAAEMPLNPSEKIWHNGKLINWDDAKIHIMSHVVNYGSSVFEGVRCYMQPQGPGIFRAAEHAQRLLDSAKIYRIEVSYTRQDIINGMV